MPHGDAEVDFEAEMQRGLPDPYCQTNWRQMVGVTGLTGFLVLGTTVYAHMDAQASDLSTLQAAAGASPAAAVPMLASQAAPSPASVVQVARAVVPGMAQANVQLVARQERP